MDGKYKVELTSDGNNTGRFFLKVTRPVYTWHGEDIGGIIICDFFSEKELKAIAKTITAHLVNNVHSHS